MNVYQAGYLYVKQLSSLKISSVSWSPDRQTVFALLIALIAIQAAANLVNSQLSWSPVLKLELWWKMLERKMVAISKMGAKQLLFLDMFKQLLFLDMFKQLLFLDMLGCFKSQLCGNRFPPEKGTWISKRASTSPRLRETARWSTATPASFHQRGFYIVVVRKLRKHWWNGGL